VTSGVLTATWSTAAMSLNAQLILPPGFNIPQRMTNNG
jgi:hypothetical protein